MEKRIKRYTIGWKSPYRVKEQKSIEELPEARVGSAWFAPWTLRLLGSVVRSSGLSRLWRCFDTIPYSHLHFRCFIFSDIIDRRWARRSVFSFDCWLLDRFVFPDFASFTPHLFSVVVVALAWNYFLFLLLLFLLLFRLLVPFVFSNHSRLVFLVWGLSDNL